MSLLKRSLYVFNECSCIFFIKAKVQYGCLYECSGERVQVCPISSDERERNACALHGGGHSGGDIHEFTECDGMHAC